MLPLMLNGLVRRKVSVQHCEVKLDWVACSYGTTSFVMKTDFVTKIKIYIQLLTGTKYLWGAKKFCVREQNYLHYLTNKFAHIL